MNMFYLLLRLVLIIIPFLALVLFGYQYINPLGQLRFSYDFCSSETPYVSGLSPLGRVLEIQKLEIEKLRVATEQEKCFQEMVVDPVYFDLRLPQSYSHAELKFELEKPVSQELRIGLGVDPDNWQWLFAEGEQIGTSVKYSFDLGQAEFERKRYRFIISAPGLDQTPAVISFRNLEVSLSKPALSRDNLGTRLRSFLDI